ncbi:regulator of sigma E protease [Trypanosoma cruzi]|nr:regulator of sigma E protease [Trypanosoma cruzi]
MQLHSSRDSFLVKDITVQRIEHYPYSQTRRPKNSLCNAKRSRSAPLLSSNSLVDTLMRTATRRSFPKPLSARDASCALRGMSLTIRKINHAPSDVSRRQKKKDTSR